MTNLIAFPDLRKAREEASMWLARLDRGLSSEERSGLREWLKDAVNNKAFLEMGKLWRGLDVICVLAELFPPGPQILNPKQRRSFLGVTLTAAAAVCIAAVGTAVLAGQAPWFFFDGSRPPVARPVTIETFATAIGESRVTKLADGSTVTLNTGTRVVVVYSPSSRDVYITYGEANFDVAHEQARPFNVHAGKRVLQATGTIFNVRVISPDNVELTVTEGKVRVLHAPSRLPDTPATLRDEIMHGETTVGALETALVEPGFQSVRKLAPGEVEARLAWQRGM